MKFHSLGCKWIISAVLLGLSSLKNEKYSQASKISFLAVCCEKKAQLIYPAYFEKKNIFVTVMSNFSVCFKIKHLKLWKL